MHSESTRQITAATKVVGVMGDPISHSMSPSIHNAAFEHLGMDWVCVAFRTPSDSAVAAVHGLVALGINGMSVTMPDKEAVIPALNRLSEDARALNAVNCISIRDGLAVGLNTDGDGFVTGLAHDFALSPKGLRCAVIGAGGAARSVILALDRAGADSIAVVNRTESKARDATELAPSAHIGEMAEIPSCELVINATSIGMASNPGMPCDPTLLGAGQTVVDLIYSPDQTAWLVAAQRNGASTANGLSMLVGQAAVAFEEWTGRVAPIDVMFKAVRSHLSETNSDKS